MGLERKAMIAMTQIGVIGVGRVGAVLAAALERAGHHITAVSGDSAASQRRAQELLPGVAVRKPTAVARSCELLLVTVPDDMIANVALTLTDAGALRPGQIVVHTSGRHGLGVLAPIARAGAVPMALHPAMTFTGTKLDLERLPGCVFGVTADPQSFPVAQQLVAQMGGTFMELPEAKRSLYHAGLAHGANHLVTLVTQAMEVLASAGANDPAATLRPLLQAALDNALASGDAALTGPIVRGDVNTVAAHLDELKQHRPATIGSYVALAQATANRAALDGRLPTLRARDIFEQLEAAHREIEPATPEQVGP